jgi:predicted DNA-binding helix-hairpin-helix protein
MKLISNPSESDIIDYNVGGALYTLKAGESSRVPNEVCNYLCRIYGFLVDEGVCIEHQSTKDADEALEKKAAKAVKKAKKDEEDLTTIHGLGKKSVKKLLDADVKTRKEFNKLTYDQLKEIIGALTASKFKSA